MTEKILKIVTDIRPEFNFSESNNYIEEGLLDSFDLVQLVNSLDTEFGISIDGMDIIPKNFSNVNTIIKVLIKNGVRE